MIVMPQVWPELNSRKYRIQAHARIRARDSKVSIGLFHAPVAPIRILGGLGARLFVMLDVFSERFPRASHPIEGILSRGEIWFGVPSVPPLSHIWRQSAELITSEVRASE